MLLETRTVTISNAHSMQYDNGPTYYSTLQVAQYITTYAVCVNTVTYPLELQGAIEFQPIMTVPPNIAPIDRMQLIECRDMVVMTLGSA